MNDELLSTVKTPMLKFVIVFSFKVLTIVFVRFTNISELCVLSIDNILFVSSLLLTFKIPDSPVILPLIVSLFSIVTVPPTI